MTKGDQRERQLQSLYDSAGWMTWRPNKGSHAFLGDPDVFEEFDVLAIEPFSGRLHGIQVKSNGARGINGFSRRSWAFRAAGITTLYAVPYDRDGWRLVEIYDAGEWVNCVDERDVSEWNMGEGVKAYLEEL